MVIVNMHGFIFKVLCVAVVTVLWLEVEPGPLAGLTVIFDRYHTKKFKDFTYSRSFPRLGKI